MSSSPQTQAEESDEEEASAEKAFLFVPEEPVELRDRLRGLAFEDTSNWTEILVADGQLADWLWEQWSHQLTEDKLDKDAYLEAVLGYKREIWIWLMGDRVWDQMLPGLIGRLQRRLPGS
jgi:hypothetical protein